jgi:hypothetical protein
MKKSKNHHEHFIFLTDCSEEIKELHGKFRAEVEGKRTVPVSLLRNILEQCKSPEDMGVAFRVLQDYRVYVSFNPYETSTLIMESSTAKWSCWVPLSVTEYSGYILICMIYFLVCMIKATGLSLCSSNLMKNHCQSK